MINAGLNQPYYWSSAGSAEIEFILQRDSAVIPIEVKSSINVRSKSLQVYRNLYQPPLQIRVSMKNIGKENDILSLPLFMAGELQRISTETFV